LNLNPSALFLLLDQDQTHRSIAYSGESGPNYFCLIRLTSRHVCRSPAAARVLASSLMNRTDRCPRAPDGARAAPCHRRLPVPSQHPLPIRHPPLLHHHPTRPRWRPHLYHQRRPCHLQGRSFSDLFILLSRKAPDDDRLHRILATVDTELGHGGSGLLAITDMPRASTLHRRLLPLARRLTLMDHPTLTQVLKVRRTRPL
jgi:hypothetical protein